MTELADLVDELLRGPRPLPLVMAGDPVLRTIAAPYDFSLPDEIWRQLIEAMRETMHAAPGVGLAAPQIGLDLRVAVIEDPAAVTPEIAAERQRYGTPPRVLVNPTYERSGAVQGAPPGPDAEFYEGCLSVPGYQAVVPRASSVRLRCSDENAHTVDELVTGWAARIVAHETDHLDGVLYLDRALIRSIASTGNLLNRRSGEPMSTIRRKLGF